MLHTKTARALLLCVLCACLCQAAFAQDAAGQSSANREPASSPGATRSDAATSGNAAPGSADVEDVRRQLRSQQEEINRMRALVAEQSQLIESLRQRVERNEQQSAGLRLKTDDLAARHPTARPSAAAGQQPAPVEGQAGETNARLARVEEQAKKTGEALSGQLGSISFSGDIRLRYESLYGQVNALANASNPALLGNELSTRQRFRLRARLALRGRFGKEFDWGLRLATGSFADAISTNQTLTDFYNRKAFGLDQAFVAWSPRRVPGLRLQGGKFDVPWLRTEMTIDNDLQPEGFSETYTRGFKDSALQELTFAAWQLPFLERGSAFVRNANGTVNVEQTGRGGRDLALYGGQLRVRLQAAPKVALTLSAADLYFSGTQFITPVQFFGGQLQLPLTVTIPATATAPAQTLTAQVSIPRDLLVAGAGGLGISTATNNAVNRDGRLSSGYNLIDLIGRLELTHSARFPVTLLLNFVTNTQTHDVALEGAHGATLLLPNHQRNGYWAELQAGKSKDRGDVQFGYTILRIEKDAVLTPFNFSDLAQQSDVRAHRLNFSYVADPHVTLSITGIITQRPNGLLGAFGQTPPGSLNTPTTRLQFDTIFRF
ncbi:MAG TPA: putative porin [Pyrinomonadaceae bacterium]|jgi:TolA-binding protein